MECKRSQRIIFIVMYVSISPKPKTIINKLNANYVELNTHGRNPSHSKEFRMNDFMSLVY